MKIEGIYKFFQDGECIGEHKNNITETGRVLAIKTLMGAIPNFGGSIHLGVDGSLNTFGYTPTQIVVSGTTPSQTVVLTVASHTLSVGNTISIAGITASGITAMNGTTQIITATTSTTITFICTTSITNATYSTAGTLGTFGQLATNTRLGFRVNSTPVLSSNINNSVSYDAILFKAKVEDPMAYKIYEVGLYSNGLINGTTNSKGQMLVGFEPSEAVDSSGNTFPTTGSVTRFVTSAENSNFRIGSYGLQVLASGTAQTLTSYDLGYVEQNDYINLAYYANGSGGSPTTTAKVTFYTDASNYVTYTFTPTATGYFVQSALISSGSFTGTMNWSSIQKIVFTATTNTIIFDGLRIEKASIIDTINGLVSRSSISSSPITKNAGSPLDIEYHMRISFNG